MAICEDNNKNLWIGTSKNGLNLVVGKEKNKLGTFGGVFTPAILTILGVIMFMRANFVVGHAGVFMP